MAKCKNLVVGCGLATHDCCYVAGFCLPTTSKQNCFQRLPASSDSPSTKTTTTTELPTKSNSIATTQTLTPDNSASAATATNLDKDIDIDGYNLIIDGVVNSPLSLSYEQLQSFPTITRDAEIICQGVKDETDSWTGVSLSTLLKEAGLAAGAGEVVFTGEDGYFVQLPLETVLESDVFLAYKMNGQTLSQDRGYPLRLVVGKSQGADWLRWLTKIEVKPALVSFENSSAAIQRLSSNIPTSGNKLCSCFLAAVIGNYQIAENSEAKTGQNDS